MTYMHNFYKSNHKSYEISKNNVDSELTEITLLLVFFH